MTQKQSQGRELIQALKRKPHTYGDMLQAAKWQSCSPWRRITESLKDDEVLVKGKRYLGEGRYATTWRVVCATRWTA